MRLRLHTRALIGAAFLAGFLLAAVGYPIAAPNDYRFELVQAQPAGAGKTTVTVRLVHLPDNKPVAGAVLFESKTDMGPGGMPEMTGKVSPLPARSARALPLSDRDRHGRQVAAGARREGARRGRHGARHRRL
jgi:hypothetical protein